MTHGEYKSLSRLMVLAAAGVLALGLAGCKPDDASKGPGSSPGGMSKQETPPAPPPTSPDPAQKK
jgi:hypothetical protein